MRSGAVSRPKGYGDPGGGSSSSSSSSPTDGSGEDTRGVLPANRAKKKKPSLVERSDSSESEQPEYGDVIAGIEKCRKGRRESAFLGYADDREIRLSERSNATQRQEGLSVRQLPDAKDLWLKTFGVPELLQFEEKYSLLQQDWVEPLRIAKHLDKVVRNRIENEANMIPKYESILRGRSILDRGKQLLTNEQIWDILKRIIEPISTEEVRRVLSQSVYPVAHYNQFKDVKAIMSNFSEFRNIWTNYDRLFMNMVNLILTKKSRQYFPQDLFGGSGKAESKEKGWIQYYFEGSPNSALVHRIYKKEIAEQERKACKEFDKFRQLFFRALMKTEKRLRQEISSKAVFEEDDTHPRSVPPADRKRLAGRSRSRFRSRVHQTEELAETLVPIEPCDSGSDDKSVADEEAVSGTDEGSDSEHEEGEAAAASDSERRVAAQANSFLAGITMDPAGKRPPVCYLFAKGKCTFPNCKYSHDPSDVKLYLDLEKNKGVFDQYAKRTGDRGRVAAGGFTKPVYGAKGTSPGVKPTYTSILRGPGSAARKTS